ncbi:hypothetical protein RF11_00793 [Thelohanellus kitauei]|uniref:Uncharacterized protein n=1 Tax=Thelohanellus kitauei TaxID=669202 RepID=A0A0C2NC52_THEKT|nr:hypothetical protein RF11_00793 [Thelohanellus kitauei]
MEYASAIQAIQNVIVQKWTIPTLTKITSANGQKLLITARGEGIVGSVNAHAKKVLRERTANRIKYWLINNLLPDVRCSDVKKCMLDYFASEQTGACSKPVTVVEKFSEELSYYTPICRVVYQSCVREFMIHINEDGKVIEVITVKQLIPSEECFHSPNFTKTVLVVLGITAGTTIATFVLACLIYYCYKNQRDQRSDEERLRRRWVLNTSGRYDITQPQEESTA